LRELFANEIGVRSAELAEWGRLPTTLQAVMRCLQLETVLGGLLAPAR
jgi:hypothetical protein